MSEVTSVHAAIRAHLALERMDFDGYAVQEPLTPADYRAALELSRAGAGDDPARRSAGSVFAVYHEGTLVAATQTWRDGPTGLPLDVICGGELQIWRVRGAALVEMGPIAVVAGVDLRRATAATVLAFLAVHRAAFANGATHVLTSAPPSLASALAALFGFDGVRELAEGRELIAVRCARVPRFVREHFPGARLAGVELWECFTCMPAQRGVTGARQARRSSSRRSMAQGALRSPIIRAAAAPLV